MNSLFNKPLILAMALLGGILLLSGCKDDVNPAVDPSPENFVYWGSNDTVYRKQMDGGSVEVLFTGADSIEEVGDLAIDPVTGYLLIMDWDANPDDIVWRGNRDGSGSLTRVITASDAVGGGSFYGMAIGPNSTVYLQVDDNCVAKVNVNGTGVDTMYCDLDILYYGLIVDGTNNRIYTLGQDKIFSAPLDGAGVPTAIVTDSTEGGYRGFYNSTTDRIVWSEYGLSDEGVLSVNSTGGGFDRLVSTTNFEPAGIGYDPQTGRIFVGTEDDELPVTKIGTYKKGDRPSANKTNFIQPIYEITSSGLVPFTTKNYGNVYGITVY